MLKLIYVLLILHLSSYWFLHGIQDVCHWIYIFNYPRCPTRNSPQGARAHKHKSRWSGGCFDETVFGGPERLMEVEWSHQPEEVCWFEVIWNVLFWFWPRLHHVIVCNHAQLSCTNFVLKAQVVRLMKERQWSRKEACHASLMTVVVVLLVSLRHRPSLLVLACVCHDLK